MFNALVYRLAYRLVYRLESRQVRVPIVEYRSILG